MQKIHLYLTYGRGRFDFLLSLLYFGSYKLDIYHMATSEATVTVTGINGPGDQAELIFKSGLSIIGSGSAGTATRYCYPQRNICGGDVLQNGIAKITDSCKGRFNAGPVFRCSQCLRLAQPSS